MHITVVKDVTSSLSIDVSGLWSPVQARKVIEALRYEAEELGVQLVPVDVTEFGMEHRRVVIALCSC